MQPQTPLKVNFTDEEANSKPREVPPSGEYVCSIVDGEVATVKPGKPNTGKPFWKLRFVVQDGTYAGTSLRATVMLFDGALYQFSQLMRALDFDVNSGEFEVPTLDKIVGQQVIVKGFKRPPSMGDDGRELPERFEVKVYKKATQGSKKSGNSALLP
jgi:hypothetical protein